LVDYSSIAICHNSSRLLCSHDVSQEFYTEAF